MFDMGERSNKENPKLERAIFESICELNISEEKSNKITDYSKMRIVFYNKFVPKLTAQKIFNELPSRLIDLMDCNRTTNFTVSLLSTNDQYQCELLIEHPKLKLRKVVFIHYFDLKHLTNLLNGYVISELCYTNHVFMESNVRYDKHAFAEELRKYDENNA